MTTLNTTPAPHALPSDYAIEQAMLFIVRESKARNSQKVELNPAQEAEKLLELSTLILDDKATYDDIAEAMEILENNPEATDDDTFNLYLDISEMTRLDGEVIEFIAIDSMRLHNDLNDVTEILNNLTNTFTDKTDDKVMNTVLENLEALEALEV